MADVPTPPESSAPDDPVRHALKNHLSVVIGFCDLLLRDFPADTGPGQDIAEVRRSAHAALELVNRLGRPAGE